MSLNFKKGDLVYLDDLERGYPTGRVVEIIGEKIFVERGVDSSIEEWPKDLVGYND